MVSPVVLAQALPSASSGVDWLYQFTNNLTIRQFDDLVIALEEPETKLALQLKNSSAESRLINSQPFGSPRKV